MADVKEIEIKIPNLGEAEETEIIEISVNIGDEVKINDPLLVLESEKAAMEVPSDFSGKIKEIKVKQGENVKEGQLFMVIETEDKEESAPQSIQVENEPKEIPLQKQSSNIPMQTFSGINAGPAVRKIAREMEIDLKKIVGSGKNSMITKDDLKNYIHSLGNASSQKYASIDGLKGFGPFSLIKQSKIQALGAKNLHQSWVMIPHVTHFEEIDITLIEEQRTELNKNSKIKITPLSYIALFLAKTLKEFPIFNSSLVGEGEIILREYINLGIAVDTKDGLIVPVIKDADKLGMSDIANEIISLADKAKNKKLMQKNLEGATFSISSLGSIGGTGFTPIINPPEVGIIGVSRSRDDIYLDNKEVKERTILPVALSYDHRVINGADAGKFMTHLKKLIENGIK